MNYRGQGTIFVIVAAILVVMILIFFVIFRGPEIEVTREFDNPENYIGKCIKDALKEKIEIMIPQGGFVNPVDYKIYNDTKITYLCKNVNYYDSCVNQYPRYLNSLKEEIEREIKQDVGNCYISLEGELKDKNYKVSGGNLEVIAELKPNFVELKAVRDFTMSKGEDVRRFDSFTAKVESGFYDLARIAVEITSSEARFCYFEYVGFDILYNNLDVRKWVMSDTKKIYSIKDKNTQEEMNIAVRGCVIPAGF